VDMLKFVYTRVPHRQHFAQFISTRSIRITQNQTDDHNTVILCLSA